MIWSFQIYNLFGEIFKFRQDKSNNAFREILKCFCKTAKFEFFVKQVIYLESQDHRLQNDMIYLCSKGLKFFRISKNGLKSDYLAKIGHKIAKLNIFLIFKMIRTLSDDI